MHSMAVSLTLDKRFTSCLLKAECDCCVYVFLEKVLGYLGTPVRNDGDTLLEATDLKLSSEILVYFCASHVVNNKHFV